MSEKPTLILIFGGAVGFINWGGEKWQNQPKRSNSQIYMFGMKCKSPFISLDVFLIFIRAEYRVFIHKFVGVQQID